MAQYIVPATILMGQETGESPGIAVPGAVDPIPPNPYAHSSVGLFADETKDFDGQSDNAKQTPATLLRTLTQINAAGGGRTVVGDDVTGRITIKGASFTGPLAGQVVMVRPDDVGLSPNQIPPIKTSLTNAQLSLHPAVFFRKSERCRTVFSQQEVDVVLEPVNDGNPLVGAFPLVVPSAPLYSEWVIMVDGTAQTVIIQHPAGSDLRRPRDVWEQVWLKAIASSNNNPGALLTYSNLGSDFVIRSALTRLSYLSYARCNGFYDANGAILLQPVYPAA